MFTSFKGRVSAFCLRTFVYCFSTSRTDPQPITRFDKIQPRALTRQEQEGSQRLLQLSRVSLYRRKWPQRHEPAFPVRPRTRSPFTNSVPLWEPPNSAPRPQTPYLQGEPAARSTFRGQCGRITSPPRGESGDAPSHPVVFLEAPCTLRPHVTICSILVQQEGRLDTPGRLQVCFQ